MGKPWEIIQGDVKRVLPQLESNSFDFLLCDPPYGLSFMGKRWDYFVPSANVWAEALRVLRPGAHAIIFGGSRTYHRMACAVEDGGFEIRDCLMWLFGCLTDDVEVLTERGWKRGVDLTAGERVAAWDSESSAIRLEGVQDTICKPWDGPLVRFVNDDTDQLLTPNHRVYLQLWERVQEEGVRRGTWTPWHVREARDVNRYQRMRLPLAGFHDGPGLGGEDYAAFLGWVWSEGGFDHSGSGVRVYQSMSANPEKVAEIEALFARVAPARRRYDRERVYRYKGVERPYTETMWFISGDIANRVRADLPDKHPTFDLLWRMTLGEKRAFWDAAMKGDGSGHDFYQKDVVDLEWAQALVATIGIRGKIALRKAPRDGGSLCVTQRATTELQHRHLQTESAHYRGDVWCIRVPSGAFVARRMGKVFITGNSGFPKSHNVSRALDERSGKKRPVVRTEARMNEPSGIVNAGRGAGARTKVERQITASVSDIAKAYDGYGTALKPAFEPAILARKMLDGTVDENVSKWGVGALAIDASRVGVDGGTRKASPAKRASVTAYGDGLNGGGVEAIDAGRWPANVILSHAEECEDGACAEACPVRILDEQSGDRPSTLTGRADPGSVHKHPDPLRSRGSMFGNSNAGGCVYADNGGASRFFYTAKASRAEREAGLQNHAKRGAKGVGALRDGERSNGEIANTHTTVKPLELCRYLARLGLPPKIDRPRRALVMFSGSGSEMIACMQAGWDEVVGIEREAEYIEIAKGRIQNGGVLSNLNGKVRRERESLQPSGRRVYGRFARDK